MFESSRVSGGPTAPLPFAIVDDRDVAEPWGLNGGPGFHPGQGYSEFSHLMAHAGLLMERSIPVGMAVIIGEADEGLRRQLRDQICRSGECIAWAGWGPLLAVVFRRGLADEPAPLMGEVLARYPGLRVGAAFSGDLDNPGDLWLAARLALEAAMGRREGLVVLGDGEAARSVREHRMACALRRALGSAAGEIVAHFQPQVLLESLVPAGLEALARWTWNGVEVLPGDFIPVAERHGLIVPLGESILRQGARALARLRRAGVEVPKIAVNVSPEQVIRGDLLRTALDVLTEEGLNAADMEFEMTEGAVSAGGSELLHGFAELARSGFGIVIDDFGSGTPFLSRIRDIPASKLKLDRAFVSPLPEDAACRRIGKVAVNFARSLGMLLVAEGIETSDQALFFRDAGCQLGQGHLWAPAMPEASLAQWWQAR